MWTLNKATNVDAVYIHISEWNDEIYSKSEDFVAQCIWRCRREEKKEIDTFAQNEMQDECDCFGDWQSQQQCCFSWIKKTREHNRIEENTPSKITVSQL